MKATLFGLVILASTTFAFADDFVCELTVGSAPTKRSSSTAERRPKTVSVGAQGYRCVGEIDDNMIVQASLSTRAGEIDDVEYGNPERGYSEARLANAICVCGLQ